MPESLFSRRAFLSLVGAGLGASLARSASADQSAARAAAIRRPQSSEFVFARLRYDSGDWDYNPKVAGNILDSIVQYTSIPVYPEEIVITADSPELLAFPFLFMTGHKLVRFNERERQGLRAPSVTYAQLVSLPFSVARSSIGDVQAQSSRLPG